MRRIYFSQNPTHAVVAYLVSKYNDVNQVTLGRTTLQKLCYLSKAQGVPLSLSFDIHHYGPFSVDLFRVTDELIADKIIEDRIDDPAQSAYAAGARCISLLRQQRRKFRNHERTLDRIVNLFRGMSASKLELITTTHYIYCSQKVFKTPIRKQVVDSVFKIKKRKFSRQEISETFQALKHANLLTWAPKRTF